MSIASNLRARAEYMREFGFSCHFGDPNEPTCFIGAGPYEKGAIEFLRAIIFNNETGHMAGFELEAAGWNTNDAIAALEIAACCAEAEGK